MISDQLLQNTEFVELAKEQLTLENQKASIELASMLRTQERVFAEREFAGEFVFVGPVAEQSVHYMIEKLESFSKRNPGEPATILLNSGGGSVIDGLALIDYLEVFKQRGHHLTIHAIGLCASMAGAILMVADERVMSPRCYLGMHEVANQLMGTMNVTQMDDLQKFTKSLQDQVVKLLCARSALTPAKLKAMWKRKDIYVTAEKCLALGLIERIA